MAKLTEILTEERKRDTAEEKRQIHLFADGKFYRAYEWSAWLCCTYINQFKVTKRQIQSVDAPMLFIGFPQTSIEKFSPEGVKPQVVTEGHLLLTLPEIMIKGIDTMPDDFIHWKETIPLSEAKEKPQPVLANRPVSLTGVMKQVLQYKVEQHSPVECMQFVSDLQRQLVELL